jgi:cbb3-type cytochrome oxidase maturation protein
MTESEQSALLAMWIIFTSFGLLGLAMALVWALRSGQFGDQRRARELALHAALGGDGPAVPPAAKSPPEGESPGAASTGGKEPDRQ